MANPVPNLSASSAYNPTVPFPKVSSAFPLNVTVLVEAASMYTPIPVSFFVESPTLIFPATVPWEFFTNIVIPPFLAEITPSDVFVNIPFSVNSATFPPASVETVPSFVNVPPS